MSIIGGQTIRQLRLSKGLSQENISEELSISVSAFSKIERGQTDLGVTRLLEILRILDVQIKDFFDIYLKLDSNNSNTNQKVYPEISTQSNPNLENLAIWYQDNQNEVVEKLNTLISLVEDIRKSDTPSKPNGLSAD